MLPTLSNRSRYSFLSVGVGLLLALLSGCHHKGGEDTPNPCQMAKANPLTFHYLEYTGTPTADTAYNNQPIAFVGPGAPYTAYEWLVGPSTTRTAQQFVLSFDAYTLGNIPVRLIARRPPNTACFPHDDGVDTLTQVLTLVPLRDLRAPIYGKFQGANRDTPRDTFSVRIYSTPDYKHPTNPEPLNYAVGIPKGCRTPYHGIGLAWRGITATSGGCTSFDITKGYLTTRDSIYIEYRVQVAPTIIDKVFVGKRVH